MCCAGQFLFSVVPTGVEQERNELVSRREGGGSGRCDNTIKRWRGSDSPNLLGIALLVKRKNVTCYLRIFPARYTDGAQVENIWTE